MKSFQKLGLLQVELSESELQALVLLHLLFFIIEISQDAFHWSMQEINFLHFLCKYVSSALTFCTTAPKGQSMPTHARWQICRGWQAMEMCLRKLNFHKTLSVYICVCRYIYLVICAGTTSCGVNATHSIPSAASFTLRSEVGLYQTTTSLLQSAPSHQNTLSLPSVPDTVLQWGMPLLQTLWCYLGEK